MRWRDRTGLRINEQRGQESSPKWICFPRSSVRGTRFNAWLRENTQAATPSRDLGHEAGSMRSRLRKKPRLDPEAALEGVHVEHREARRAQTTIIGAVVGNEYGAGKCEFDGPQLPHVDLIVFPCAFLGRSLAVIPFLRARGEPGLQFLRHVVMLDRAGDRLGGAQE